MQDPLFQVALTTCYSSVCSVEVQLIVVVTILLLLLHVTDHMFLHVFWVLVYLTNIQSLNLAGEIRSIGNQFLLVQAHHVLQSFFCAAWLMLVDSILQ